jgi:hypothetical protein
MFRTQFEPSGGWKGKVDHIDFDIWEHIDKPPKGRDFGLRTHKLFAHTHNEKSKERLINDHNAWVGFPTKLLTTKEAKEPMSDFERRLRETSAYAKPLFSQVNHKHIKRLPKTKIGIFLFFFVIIVE